MNQIIDTRLPSITDRHVAAVSVTVEPPAPKDCPKCGAFAERCHTDDDNGTTRCAVTEEPAETPEERKRRLSRERAARYRAKQKAAVAQ